MGWLGAPLPHWQGRADGIQAARSARAYSLGPVLPAVGHALAPVSLAGWVLGAPLPLLLHPLLATGCTWPRVEHREHADARPLGCEQGVPGEGDSGWLTKLCSVMRWRMSSPAHVCACHPQSEGMPGRVAGPHLTCALARWLCWSAAACGSCPAALRWHELEHSGNNSSSISFSVCPDVDRPRSIDH